MSELNAQGKPKGRPGRKRWVPPDRREVEVLAERGLTYTQIARKMGVSMDTLARRRKENAEFEEAINVGKARGLAAVANALYDNAIKDKNVAAQIFIMKCVGKWTSTEKVEVTGADSGPIDVKTTVSADKDLKAILETYVDVARTIVEGAADPANVAGHGTGEEVDAAELGGVAEPLDS